LTVLLPGCGHPSDAREWLERITEQNTVNANRMTTSVATIALTLGCAGLLSWHVREAFVPSTPREMLEETNAGWAKLNRDLAEMDVEISAMSTKLGELRQRRLSEHAGT
jgi:hypothetical protein